MAIDDGLLPAVEDFWEKQVVSDAARVRPEREGSHDDGKSYCAALFWPLASDEKSDRGHGARSLPTPRPRRANPAPGAPFQNRAVRRRP
ncbi:hypothetical protein CCR94_01150 [Rhodoblastus sphagnicola]|uniref:Uncharacterized protein n=1 Tax=Rhodoblastus sphagnicola TaxID=333368 RepID=A0A2S6NG40_9HYPH|nr:hypothetical protein [Rhodoblastus sphagnicola]MBB4200824.1 hypothetical protein [Rhodoblastus sphagnicola]PPQ33615.1 hypothetical protein CCR94_01150 [Rhodoblastus sphagnicola]